MNIDLPLVLTVLVLITGIIWGIDAYVFARTRETGEKPHALVEISRGYFPVFLVVLLIRSFWFEAYRIPSQSLEPTLTVGDFVLVNKYEYGLKLPVINKKFVPVSKPKRGDIMVLRYPPNPKIYYIKRVIGLPGDKIEYENKRLTINGKPVDMSFIAATVLQDMDGQPIQVNEYDEDLFGRKHKVYLTPSSPARDMAEIEEVPEGSYFVLGDNRDQSGDSRYFGFVPEENIVGRATRVLFSWNKKDFNIRSDRNLKKII